jgi:hypothetical protein
LHLYQVGSSGVLGAGSRAASSLGHERGARSMYRLSKTRPPPPPPRGGRAAGATRPKRATTRAGPVAPPVVAPPFRCLTPPPCPTWPPPLPWPSAPLLSAVRCYRPASEAFCELSPTPPLLFPIPAKCVAVGAEPHPASSLSRASKIFALHGRGWAFLAHLSHRRQNASPVYLPCRSVFCLCTVTTAS